MMNFAHALDEFPLSTHQTFAHVQVAPTAPCAAQLSNGRVLFVPTNRDHMRSVLEAPHAATHEQATKLERVAPSFETATAQCEKGTWPPKKWPECAQTRSTKRKASPRPAATDELSPSPMERAPEDVAEWGRGDDSTDVTMF